MADASGSLPLELLDRGDPAFVDAIRQIHDADVLAAFAEVWFKDQRPDSRRLLFAYLDRPLNAYRHEGLVKRLFKLTEAAGDDELMARFLVLFDRSIRRVRKTRTTWMQEKFTTKAEAQQTAKLWSELGYRNVNQWGMLGHFRVNGSRPDEVIRQPVTSPMPREPVDSILRFYSTEYLQSRRLFSLATRNYLRRRAWRYFRKLGKAQPERYVAAVAHALKLYRDEDVADSLALIDNWGLIHILFHHSPALEAKPNGWTVKAGRSLGELSPTPIYENLWDQAPQETVGLLSNALSKTVRRWAIRRVEADPSTHRAGLPLEGWLDLLGHNDPEIVGLTAMVLEGFDRIESVTVDRWLALAESTDPAGLDVLCRLIGRHVRADEVTLEQAVKLAGRRPLPVARLGFGWLKAKSVREPSAILSLIDAECSLLRPEILGWLRSTLAGSLPFEPGLMLEFLDSRHADARAEGWAWFQSEPRAFEDFGLWQKLLESPYDDIRLALVAELETRVKYPRLLSDLRPLWASVLLNIHRGARAKPVVVRQLLDRLRGNPTEIIEPRSLLPLLGVALRSSRGPERRAGLVAIVQLVEKRPELAPLVRSSFPELQGIGESD